MNNLIVLMSFALMANQVWADSSNATTAKKSMDSLENQLKSLDEGSQLPAGVNKEKIYSVQQRNLPLRFKSEFTVGGGMNLTPDSFIKSEQFEVGYRFHFNDRWAVGLAQSWVNNQFRPETEDLRTVQGAVPNVPFAYSHTDLMAEFNAFYAKFRWGADFVSYFDLYVAAGPGFVVQNTGTVGSGVADVGLAVWLGRWGSFRMGLKDYVYNETYTTGTSLQQNLHAHLDMGYLF